MKRSDPLGSRSSTRSFAPATVSIVVRLGEATLIEVNWKALSDMQSGVFHHLNDGQRRILTLLAQDLTSVEISYNLFARTRALPATVRDAFHHAKCYVGAIRRYLRLMESMPRYGWPGPVATRLKQLVKVHAPKLDRYTDARDAIEHVDQHGKTAVWWMAALVEDELLVKKDASGAEIRIPVVGGDALSTCVAFNGEALRAIVDHFGTEAAPRSQPK